ncbi:hypothetical protein GCM10027048_02200 [Hymenobacter coalescens]
MNRFFSLRRWLPLCLPLLALTTTDSWAPFAIDEQVSVELPTPPQEIDAAKLGLQLPNTRLLMAQDTVGLYQLTRLELTAAQAATTQGEAARQRFYDGVVKGALNGQQDAVLLARTPFQTAGGDGIELKMRARHKGTGKLVVKFSRALLVGRIGYTLTFLPLDKADTAGVSGSAQRQRYFNSLVVKAPASNEPPRRRP